MKALMDPGKDTREIWKDLWNLLCDILQPMPEAVSCIWNLQCIMSSVWMCFPPVVSNQQGYSVEFSKCDYAHFCFDRMTSLWWSCSTMVLYLVIHHCKGLSNIEGALFFLLLRNLCFVAWTLIPSCSSFCKI